MILLIPYKQDETAGSQTIFDGKLVLQHTEKESCAGSAILSWWKQEHESKRKFMTMFFKGET